MNKISIHQEVTNWILEELKAGTPPWIRPWNATGVCIPENFKSKIPYKGINIMILWASALRNKYTTNLWITYKQAMALGGNVRKEESKKYTNIIFWSIKTETNDKGEEEKKFFPIRHCVYNVEQCDGLDVKAYESSISEDRDEHWEPIEDIQRIIKETGADIRHGGSEAFYDPVRDYIGMPPEEAFPDSSNYYTTAFHELTHWTNHQSRLNRKEKGKFGTKAYAREELVAEIGSAFLGAELGLPITELQHPSYIASWIKVLEDDSRAIIHASAAAQKAVDFILKRKDRYQKKENQ